MEGLEEHPTRFECGYRTAEQRNMLLIDKKNPRMFVDTKLECDADVIYTEWDEPNSSLAHLIEKLKDRADDFWMFGPVQNFWDNIRIVFWFDN